jgi:cyclase
MVATSVTVPVIAHGGAGKSQHFSQVVKEGKADAVAVASMIHYDFIANRQSDMSSRSEGNVSFLKSGRTNFGKIQPLSIHEIKESLQIEKIACRI